MSPPCQPYTRQHPATENDPRSNALLHLIKSITKLKNPPRYLALENVIGFEESPACRTLLDTLEGMGYNFRQFALSPTQFGIPNERPRYYLLAVLHGEFPISGPDTSLPIVTGQSRNSRSGQPESVENTVGIISAETPTSIHSNPAVAVDDNKDTLTESATSEESSILNFRTVRASIPGLLPTPPRPLKSYLADSLPLADIERLLVPAKSLEKNASWCLDIVTPNDTHTSCFTKSYSKYFKGTGSVLLIPDPYPVIDQKEATISIESSSSSSSSSSKMQESSNDVAVSNIYNNAQAVAVAAPAAAGVVVAGAERVSQADTSSILVRSDLAANGTASSDFRESPETRTFDLNWKDKLNGNKLRFFSPDELLRLFGFLPLKNTRINLKRSTADFEENSDIPEECSADDIIQPSQSSFFPENIANVNCYQMIGNSLSVTVVSHLLHHMLSCTFTKSLS
jgi:site-specific DNA-cytosine methylase